MGGRSRGAERFVRFTWGQADYLSSRQTPPHLPAPFTRFVYPPQLARYRPAAQLGVRDAAGMGCPSIKRQLELAVAEKLGLAARAVGIEATAAHVLQKA